MAQERRWHTAGIRLRGHIFRLWTASAVLAGFIYGLIYSPEWLTWWKRATEDAVHAACAFVPYPWGDRIEATVGNFGLWVQITLAIISFRLFVWIFIVAVRRVRALSPGQIRTRD
jgi:hypothetical protein